MYRKKPKLFKGKPPRFYSPYNHCGCWWCAEGGVREVRERAAKRDAEDQMTDYLDDKAELGDLLVYGWDYHDYEYTPWLDYHELPEQGGVWSFPRDAGLFLPCYCDYSPGIDCPHYH